MSEPNFHTKKIFTENLLAMEMKKTEILVNKPVYLGHSIPELSKILMYGEKAKLCFIVYIKSDDIPKNIAEHVESRFDTSKYELGRPHCLQEKIKKVIGVMKKMN